MKMTNDIEVRCPHGMQRLFARLKSEGEKPVYVNGTLIEVACYDCAKNLRKSGRDVSRVRHQFNILGELVNTVIDD